jgi:peptidoglycan-associated lipoprotein
MRLAPALIVLTAAVALAGCPKKFETKPDDGVGETTSTSTTSGTSGLSGSGDQAGGASAAEMAALRQLEEVGMVIYFDYDKAEIKSEFVPVVAAHARFLNGGANRRIRIEGHTDERGSREYNIGLGERRAQAVRRALMLQGVGDGQVTTVSYGEERPAVPGNDESAYSRNRRAELSYGR